MIFGNLHVEFTHLTYHTLFYFDKKFLECFSDEYKSNTKKRNLSGRMSYTHTRDHHLLSIKRGYNSEKRVCFERIQKDTPG